MLKAKDYSQKRSGHNPSQLRRSTRKSLGRFKSAGTMIREIDLAEAVSEPCEIAGVKTIATNKAARPKSQSDDQARLQC